MPAFFGLFSLTEQAWTKCQPNHKGTKVTKGD